jgi:multimeric flavodoxin WrbA
MKVVGIIGSPRLWGNTSLLVQKILDGASSKSAETKIFILNTLQISACQACNHCRPKGDCILNDDMQDIYRALESATAIVVGTPIYMGQMSAQTKLFVDRLYAHYVANKGKNVPIGLVFTYGAPGRDVYSDYIAYTAKIFTSLGYDVRGVITAGNAGAPGVVLEDADIMEKAVALGESLVSGL